MKQVNTLTQFFVLLGIHFRQMRRARVFILFFMVILSCCLLAFLASFHMVRDPFYVYAPTILLALHYVGGFLSLCVAVDSQDLLRKNLTADLSMATGMSQFVFVGAHFVATFLTLMCAAAIAVLLTIAGNYFLDPISSGYWAHLPIRHVLGMVFVFWVYLAFIGLAVGQYFSKLYALCAGLGFWMFCLMLPKIFDHSWAHFQGFGVFEEVIEFLNISKLDFMPYVMSDDVISAEAFTDAWQLFGWVSIVAFLLCYVQRRWML